MAEDLFERQLESLRDVYATAIRNLEGAFWQLKGAKWDLDTANKALRREKNVLRSMQQFCEAVYATLRFGETFDYWETKHQNISELKAKLVAKRKAYKKAQMEHRKASNYIHAVQILLGEEVT